MMMICKNIYSMKKCMSITFLFIPSSAPEARTETSAKSCWPQAGFGLVMIMICNNSYDDLQ